MLNRNFMGAASVSAIVTALASAIRVAPDALGDDSAPMPGRRRQGGGWKPTRAWWRTSSCYVPGGPRANVSRARERARGRTSNARLINEQFDLWNEARKVRQVSKNQ